MYRRGAPGVPEGGTVMYGTVMYGGPSVWHVCFHDHGEGTTTVMDTTGMLETILQW